MDKAAFLAEMAELLELDSSALRLEDKLEDLENWNSMAMIGYLALADSASGKKLSPRQIRECETIADLAQLAGIG
ncbi:MAG: phosphopantetheine-binding protein [Acidobacteriota bacterium]|jgi:acyl carrier protein